MHRVLEVAEKVTSRRLEATGGGVRGQKNMLILFKRFHHCGVNAFCAMSGFVLFRSYQCFNVLAL